MFSQVRVVWGLCILIRFKMQIIFVPGKPSPQPWCKAKLFTIYPWFSCHLCGFWCHACYVWMWWSGIVWLLSVYFSTVINVLSFYFTPGSQQIYALDIAVTTMHCKWKQRWRGYQNVIRWELTPLANAGVAEWEVSTEKKHFQQLDQKWNFFSI